MLDDGFESGISLKLLVVDTSAPHGQAVTRCRSRETVGVLNWRQHSTPASKKLQLSQRPRALFASVSPGPRARSGSSASAWRKSRTSCGTGPQPAAPSRDFRPRQCTSDTPAGKPFHRSTGFHRRTPRLDRLTWRLEQTAEVVRLLGVFWHGAARQTDAGEMDQLPSIYDAQ